MESKRRKRNKERKTEVKSGGHFMAFEYENDKTKTQEKKIIRDEYKETRTASYTSLHNVIYKHIKRA